MKVGMTDHTRVSDARVSVHRAAGKSGCGLTEEPSIRPVWHVENVQSCGLTGLAGNGASLSS